MCPPVEKPICTSGYGWRTVFKKPNFHPGTDLVSLSGNRSVYAVYPGIVVTDFDNYNHSLRWKNRRHSAGNYIAVETVWNGQKFWLRYIHLESNRVAPGQQVKPGMHLGNYGNVGMSTGPHLHLDCYNPESGKFIDPRPFFDAMKIPHKKGTSK